MSGYTCNLPSETFFEFKKEYIDLYGNSKSWTLGKSFITRFTPYGSTRSNDVLDELGYCKNDKEAQVLIFKFIYGNTWDFLALQPIKDGY